MAAEEINRQLRNRLGYTMQDLEANRAGRLSSEQSADTRWHLMTQAAMYSGAVIVITIMTLNYGSNPLIRLGLGAGGLIFVVGYFSVQWVVDVRSQRVATVAGPVSKEQYEGHGTKYLYIDCAWPTGRGLGLRFSRVY